MSKAARLTKKLVKLANGDSIAMCISVRSFPWKWKRVSLLHCMNCSNS